MNDEIFDPLAISSIPTVATSGYVTESLNINIEFKFTGMTHGGWEIPANLGPCMVISLTGDRVDFEVVIKKNRSVYAWGGRDNLTNGELNIPLNLGICKSISAGMNHT